jgi:hypothetical protein
MNSIENYAKSQTPPPDTVPQSEYNELLKNYEMLKMKLG